MVPGGSLHQEFDLLEDAGLSPLEVLPMTTLNKAQFLQREAAMGTVDEKKDADLVLLEEDLISSVQNLQKIYGVVRAGSFYSRQDLDRIQQDVAGHTLLPMPDELDAADTLIP